MPKCINNCHDLEGFWKSWHASYNKWLVRYNLFSVFISSFLVQHVTCIFCTFSLKVLIHSSRRYTEEAAQRLGCLHICCIVAWLRMVTRPTYGAFSFCLFNYWCLSDIKYILRKMLKLISFMIVLCILIVWTGSFFHGHGWLACSLFQKCWWSPQQLHSRYIWSCIPSFPFFYPLIFCLQLMLFHQCLISINKTRIHVVLRFRIVCILSHFLYISGWKYSWGGALPWSSCSCKFYYDHLSHGPFLVAPTHYSTVFCHCFTSFIVRQLLYQGNGFCNI